MRPRTRTRRLYEMRDIERAGYRRGLEAAARICRKEQRVFRVAHNECGQSKYDHQARAAEMCEMLIRDAKERAK